jgi:hypothetical protein
MSGLHDFVTGPRVIFYSRLKRYPRIFLPIARWRENYKRRLVRRTSDIVIEGYTRCGNHPALYTFLVAQGRPMDVAHHFHAPAPLMLATKWGVPALLLIRDPLDAVASEAMYFNMETPAPFLRSYINFHAPLVPYVERLVVSDFPQTVGNFSAVLAEVNRKFNRQFRLPTGSPEEQSEVERLIRAEHSDNMNGVATTLPLPTAAKNAIKERIAARMKKARYARQLAECQRLYQLCARRAVHGIVMPQ